jgi:hypothetical protein
MIRVSLATLVTIYLLLFSCGGVSILDSGRMEPPAARATVSSAPVALRDLRVRI